MNVACCMEDIGKRIFTVLFDEFHLSVGQVISDKALPLCDLSVPPEHRIKLVAPVS